MELNEVLVALEELKKGLSDVKTANENVERAANAAQKVCEAFSGCVEKLDKFSEEVIDPIKSKVDDIASASSQMVQKCNKSIDELSKQATAISESFNSAVTDYCKRIQDDVSEFHKEVESLELKLARVASRAEEKADAVIDETRKVNGVVEKGISDIVVGQTELGENITKRGDEVINELKVIKGIGSTTKKILIVVMTFSILSLAASGYLVLKGFGIVP